MSEESGGDLLQSPLGAMLSVHIKILKVLQFDVVRPPAKLGKSAVDTIKRAIVLIAMLCICAALAHTVFGNVQLALQYGDDMQMFFSYVPRIADNAEKIVFLLVCVYHIQFSSTFYIFMRSAAESNIIPYNKMVAVKAGALLLTGILFSVGLAAGFASLTILGAEEIGEIVHENITGESEILAEQMQLTTKPLWAFIARWAAFVYAAAVLSAISTMIYGCAQALVVGIKRMKSDMTDITESMGNGDLQASLAKHVQLCKTVKTMNGICRPFVFMAVAFDYPLCTFTAWYILKTPWSTLVTGALLLNIVALRLLPMLWAIARLTEEMHSFGAFLVETFAPPWHNAQRNATIRDYLIRLNAHSGGIDCYALFTVSKSFLITLLSAAFSLLIVLLQM